MAVGGSAVGVEMDVVVCSTVGDMARGVTAAVVVVTVAAGGRGRSRLVTQVRPAVRSMISETPSWRFAVLLSCRRVL
jgi:hypothetical protein